MGRHKLPFKLKKPNTHHKYWRYVLSTDPHRSEISTRTKIKYEAERIAKEAWAKAVEEAENSPTFKDYAADFFTERCKYTARRMKSNKPFSADVMKLKRSKLENYLIPYYGDLRQIMGEAVRDYFNSLSF